MANEFYDHGAVPATGSSLSSATIRAEFDAIEAGFDKLPTLAGQAGKLVKVNAGATGLDTTDAPDINGGTIDGAVIGGTSPAAGTFTNLTATGNTVIGNAATDTVTVTADVASSLIPSADNTHDLGAVGSEWRDLYITGTANIDSLVADTADVNGGTIDGATIGATTRAAGNFTTLNANGSVVLGDEAADTVTINGTVQPGVVISGSSTGDALRITQTGTGNALVVEDATSPDSSPFVVDASGKVIVGATSTSMTAGGSLHLTNTVSELRVEGSNSTAGTPTAQVNLKRASTRSAGVAFTDLDDAEVAFVGVPYNGGGVADALVARTAGVERMRIDSEGRVGIGSSSLGGSNGQVRVGKNISGGATSYGLLYETEVQSDVTTQASVYRSSVATQAAAFSLSNLFHFEARQGAIGAESSVTTQAGFVAGSSLVGATNNYGFYSNIAAATGRWNFYAKGTATNYFAGTTYVGGNGSSTGLEISGNSGGLLNHRTSSGGQLDINHSPQDGTSGSLIRLFRNTNTTGNVLLQVLLGNNSTTANHVLAVNNGQTSTLCGNNGNLDLGHSGNLTKVVGGLTINRSAVTAPAASDGNVFSGTYTPTLTNVTNVAASTAYQCQYMRVGNVVTVSGQVDIDPEATGAIRIDLSLPIASGFTANANLGGTFMAVSGVSGGVCLANTVDDRAQFSGDAQTTANTGFWFHFTYRVI